MGIDSFRKPAGAHVAPLLAPKHRQDPRKDNHFDKFGTTKCQIGRGKCPPQGKCLQTMGIYFGNLPKLQKLRTVALFLELGDYGVRILRLGNQLLVCDEALLVQVRKVRVERLHAELGASLQVGLDHVRLVVADA